MYQVIGFVAVGAAGAAVLHSWDLPKFVSFGLLSLSLIAAALVSLAQTARVEGPKEPISYTMADEMPPTKGFVAPSRRQKPRGDIAVW